MNNDPFWQWLLTESKPTFVPSAEPPYGFTTRVLARLRAQEQQHAVLEKLGFRALGVALSALAAVGIVTLVITWTMPIDPERGLEKMAQVDTFSLP